MSLFESMRKLEEKGIDLIEVLGHDRHMRSPGDLGAIIESFQRSGDDLYVELLYFLTYRRFSAVQAESIWGAIVKHKKRMEDKLDRDVRFRVAALDYLHDKTALLRGVRLVARSEMDALLSHVVIDEVSMVFNRRHFNNSLASELNRARRYGNPLTLLILDLDNFKGINDRFGHLKGDYALRQVGRLLRESTREADAVCRYGGDEFAVILPETTGSEAYTLAERIRTAVGRVVIQPSVSSGGLDGDGVGVRDDDTEQIILSASIGGATFPVDCEELEDLLRKADGLCLEAKRAGKNRIHMNDGQRPTGPTAGFEVHGAE